MQGITMDLIELQQRQEKFDTSIPYWEGNSPEFSPDRVEYDPTSPLHGKRIGFLGSSITYGFGARGISFADYLQAKDGVISTKSAVTDSTLAGTDESGYLFRLKHDFGGAYDLFVCQLSTNDGRQGKKLGSITSSSTLTGFDVDTTIGALEEVCSYVKDELKCPLAFFTCMRDDPTGEYEKLVGMLFDLQAKWKFSIIDIFNDETLKASMRSHRNGMWDDAHPTQEGYLHVWLPKFEMELTKIFSQN